MGWTAMVLVVAVVVMEICLHTPWWGMITGFLLFMGVFSHLAALYLRRMSDAASRKLDVCALVLCILAILAEVVIAIAM